MLRAFVGVLTLHLLAFSVAAQPRLSDDGWADYQPPINAPGKFEGFYRGVITRDGASQVIEMEVTRDEAGELSASVRVPDWFGWPAYKREVSLEDGTLTVKRLLYSIDFALTLDPVYGDMIGRALTGVTPITAHFRPAERGPAPPALLETELVARSNGAELSMTVIRPAAESADGYPLVVWMLGRGEWGRMWEPYVETARTIARRGFAVAVYDKRGCGESTGDFDSATLQDHAIDCEAVARAAAALPGVDGERLGLYGASAGVWVSQIVIERGELDVDAWVAVNGPFESVKDQQWHVAEAFARQEGFAEDVKERMIEFARIASSDRTDEAVLPRLRALYAEAERDGWDWILDPVEGSIEELERSWVRRNRYDPTPMLRRLDTPLLAFFGEEDVVVPPEWNIPKLESLAAEAEFDDVTIVVHRGIGHSNETPNELVELPSGGATHYYFQWNRLPAGYGATLVEWLRDRLDAPPRP